MTGDAADFSYGTTLHLAQKVDAGAQADVFISGDSDWMDVLVERGVVRPLTVVRLLANRLVLVAPAGPEVPIDLVPGFDLAELLGDGRLAIPDVETLPAGRYGKQVLTVLRSLGMKLRRRLSDP